MATLSNGTPVFCSNSKATGRFIQDLTNGLCQVELDSGRTATEYKVNVEPLPMFNIGDRVQRKDDKTALGDVIKLVNRLTVEICFDKAIANVRADVRDIQLMVPAGTQDQPTATKRGLARQKRKYERAMHARGELFAKQERQRIAKEAKQAVQNAAQAAAAKKHQQKQQKKAAKKK